MRSDSSVRSHSFIERARRAQIIAAAIEVVNAVGYAGASLARIAAQAGISKSVVSYHFAGKEELLRSVVDEVFDDTGSAMADAVDAENTWPAKLEAYIRTELTEIARHPDRFSAATEILISHRDPDGRPMMLSEDAADVELLEGILVGGVTAGVFIVGDIRVAATTITHAIDGALTTFQRDQGTNLASYSDALVPLLMAAVGATR